MVQLSQSVHGYWKNHSFDCTDLCRQNDVSVFNLLSHSVTQSCLTLSNPMDCSTPGFPVLHHLPELVSVMPSNHLILCHPLLLLPSVFPSIKVFSSKSALCLRWPKDWSFSFSISPSNEYPELISLGLTDLISLQYKRLSKFFSNTTVQKHQFFGAQLSLWSNSHVHT